MALHLLLLAAIIGLGAPWPGKLALAALLGIHGFERRPRSAALRIVQLADGQWRVPERSGVALGLGRGTGFTLLWVRLVLVGDGETIDILLLKDQLDEVTWRRLQARLRSSTLE